MKKKLLAILSLTIGAAGLFILPNQGYNKTVVQYYGNQSSFPSKISYSEYSDEYHANYSGELSITSIRPSNGGYYATYEGKLTSNYK